MHGMWHGLWWLGGLGRVIASAVIIYIVFKLFKNSGGKHYHRGEAALEILEKRYAAGEIDEAEFLAMKQNLGK